jgi:hypothetical protein
VKWAPSLSSFDAAFCSLRTRAAKRLLRRRPDPSPTKPPTTPPAIAPAWLVNSFEVPGFVGRDEVGLGVKELVVDVEVDVKVAVPDDVEDVLELNTLLLSTIRLLASFC